VSDYDVFLADCPAWAEQHTDDLASVAVTRAGAV